MDNLTVALMHKLGHTNAPSTCKNCKYFKEDGTTDNFGPGDRCTRNPDIPFPTHSFSYCIGFTTIKGD